MVEEEEEEAWGGTALVPSEMKSRMLLIISSLGLCIAELVPVPYLGEAPPPPPGPAETAARAMACRCRASRSVGRPSSQDESSRSSVGIEEAGRGMTKLPAPRLLAIGGSAAEVLVEAIEKELLLLGAAAPPVDDNDDDEDDDKDDDEASPPLLPEPPPC